MKKIALILVAFACMISCNSSKKSTTTNRLDATETSVKLIDSVSVKKHLYTLASDEMEGRKPGTPGIEKAAKYIENEFKRIGLNRQLLGSPELIREEAGKLQGFDQ